MTEAEVLQVIGDLARRQFTFTGPLQREMRLAEDLGLDSLRLLTLAVEVENRFEIFLSEEAEAEIVTVGDLVDVIRQLLTDGGGPGAGRRLPEAPA